MKILTVMILVLALVGCQDSEKTETKLVSPTLEKKAMSTQAVKKSEVKPAIIQDNIEQVSKDVASSLAVMEDKVNPCTAKSVVINPCSVKPAAVMVNVHDVKVAVVKNPCTPIKVATPVKKAIVINKPTAVKVTSNFTGKCKACHKTAKDAVGPSFKKIQAAYGSSLELAKTFKSGFAVDSRKVAASEPKFKKKAGMMTSQYKKLIKKNVEAGKLTYQALADEIFSK